MDLICRPDGDHDGTDDRVLRQYFQRIDDVLYASVRFHTAVQQIHQRGSGQ
jgi:hypothetical protein